MTSGTRPTAQRRARWISAATLLTLVVAWEVAGHLVPKSPLRESPIIPPWEFVFGRSFLGIADYWRIPIWAPVPQLGGARTYTGAILAILYHSSLTLLRVAGGLGVGSALGVAIGLVLSWSRLVRRLIALPIHLLRLCPLLALIPLFQFWFGATNGGAVAYVAFGVGTIFLVGTINAVANVPRRYIESARTFGATKLQIYRAVVWPAIRPELLSSLFLTLGLAWSAAVGAEYIGVESGIGRMIIWAENFSQTGRMVLLTLVLLLYANLGLALCHQLQKRWLAWLPQHAVRA